jgi:signal peptidase II
LQERRALSPLRDEQDLRDRQRRTRLFVVAACAAVVLAADQITKSIAVHDLSRGPVHVIGPLSFVLGYNTGAAFSIGAGFTLPIIVIAFVLVLILVWFAKGAPSLTAAVGTGMILGGALGNLSDRLFRGHSGAVVDFIHLDFWATFNVADASIVVGTIVLLVAMVRRPGAPIRTDATQKR